MERGTINTPGLWIMWLTEIIDGLPESDWRTRPRLMSIRDELVRQSRPMDVVKEAA